MNGLDLFSGIGGLSIALSEWVRPIAYCEIDQYCQGILLSRISDGSLVNAPIWDDIKTLSYDGRNWPGIDIIYGGFPCQGISIAGLGKGLEDERSGLVYEIFRLSRDIRPTFIFLENVPAITTRGGLALVQEITKMRYDCRWCVISAAFVGAPHKRERWFLLANSYDKRCDDAKSEMESKINSQRDIQNYWEKTQSPILGMDNGIPYWSHRIKSLGNAVVPQQAKEAFKILMGL